MSFRKHQNNKSMRSQYDSPKMASTPRVTRSMAAKLIETPNLNLLFSPVRNVEHNNSTFYKSIQSRSRKADDTADLTESMVQPSKVAAKNEDDDKDNSSILKFIDLTDSPAASIKSSPLSRMKSIIDDTTFSPKENSMMQVTKNDIIYVDDTQTNHTMKSIIDDTTFSPKETDKEKSIMRVTKNDIIYDDDDHDDTRTNQTMKSIINDTTFSPKENDKEKSIMRVTKNDIMYDDDDVDDIQKNSSLEHKTSVSVDAANNTLATNNNITDDNIEKKQIDASTPSPVVCNLTIDEKTTQLENTEELNKSIIADVKITNNNEQIIQNNITNLNDGEISDYDQSFNISDIVVNVISNTTNHKLPPPSLKKMRKRSFSASEVNIPKKHVTFGLNLNSSLSLDKLNETENKKKKKISYTPKPNQSKVKTTNFAAIHKLQFNRMESIEEYIVRRQERSIKLRQIDIKTPTSNKRQKSIVENNDEMMNNNVSKCNDNLKNEKENDVIIKSNISRTKIISSKTNLFGVSSTNNNNSINNLNVSERGRSTKISDRQQKNMTLFKNQGRYNKDSTLQHQESITKRLDIIKGVRSNRRFDLLMQFRNSQAN